ncbi:MAG TPA: hypothetical protein VMZ52_00945 [Bryobacteraceae bacterium]|nr:hypothetical protein [Bryobacteraceae bacterium]
MSTTPNPLLRDRALDFHHRWIYDPIPDWILSIADKSVLKEVAAIQLDLQRTVLEAQIKSIDATKAALGRMK